MRIASSGVVHATKKFKIVAAQLIPGAGDGVAIVKDAAGTTWLELKAVQNQSEYMYFGKDFALEITGLNVDTLTTATLVLVLDDISD